MNTYILIQREASHKILHSVKPKLSYPVLINSREQYLIPISIAISYIHGITWVIKLSRIHIFTEFNPKTLFIILTLKKNVLIVK